MVLNALFCSTLIFVIFIFLFKNVYSGANCGKKTDDNLILKKDLPISMKDVHCTVLRTVDSCFKNTNPWKDPEYKVFYEYISTGYKVGDKFLLKPSDTSSESGIAKKVFKGWHKPPNSNQIQNVVIKYFTEQLKWNELVKKEVVSELLLHATWTLATHEIMTIERMNYIWTQPIVAFCPNLFSTEYDVAFIEPSIKFYNPDQVEKDKTKLMKLMKGFTDEIEKKFGFEGADYQGFDHHDFGNHKYDVTVMTDVMINMMITRADHDLSPSKKKKRSVYDNFMKEKFDKTCGGDLDKSLRQVKKGKREL